MATKNLHGGIESAVGGEEAHERYEIRGAVYASSQLAGWVVEREWRLEDAAGERARGFGES